MSNQLMIGGIVISPIVAACVLAMTATFVLSLLLSRLGFYRIVWNRPLVEVAMFCILLAAAGRLPIIGIST
ncbi:DUF1656 domain-containing protein [Sphingomonas trueperi]|uniref:DUF1656 domain-containing protein n=1 Tax=Sphingomonas trueperi TaxID=53317 RepID=UPI001C7CEB45